MGRSGGAATGQSEGRRGASVRTGREDRCRPRRKSEMRVAEDRRRKQVRRARAGVPVTKTGDSVSRDGDVHARDNAPSAAGRRERTGWPRAQPSSKEFRML